jgi:hypothetical protein
MKAGRTEVEAGRKKVRSGWTVKVGRTRVWVGRTGVEAKGRVKRPGVEAMFRQLSRRI